MSSSLHWWNWTKPQESFWWTFAKYTHAQQHSWASCGATFQLHGPQYFRFQGVWCGDGSMRWNRHPTEAVWNEGFLAARNRSNLKDWISISAALAIIYTRSRLIFMSMTIAKRRNNNGFLDIEEDWVICPKRLFPKNIWHFLTFQCNIILSATRKPARSDVLVFTVISRCGC